MFSSAVVVQLIAIQILFLDTRDQLFSKRGPEPPGVLERVAGGPQQHGESFIFTTIPPVSNTVAECESTSVTVFLQISVI